MTDPHQAYRAMCPTTPRPRVRWQRRSAIGGTSNATRNDLTTGVSEPFPLLSGLVKYEHHQQPIVSRR